MAQTNPIRVPETVHNEVRTVARLFDVNPSELLANAWDHFRRSPEFIQAFGEAQKAFSVGDVDHVAEKLYGAGAVRAKARAEAVKALRAR